MKEYREKLKDLGRNVRYHFRGDFARNGLKSKNYLDAYYNKRYDPTMLLTNVEVEIEGEWEMVAEHLWVNLTKQFLEFGWFNEGDVVEFDARVNDYQTKNGKNYKIERPSQVNVSRNGKLVDKNNTLIVLKPLDIEKAIMKQNEEFYSSREMLHKLFDIENYATLARKWSKLHVCIYLDDIKFDSLKQFKDYVFKPEDLIKLAESVKNGEVSFKKEYYSKNKLLSEEEVEEQIVYYLEVEKKEKLRKEYEEYEKFIRGK